MHATDFPPGTHLVTPRRGYLHHGIYVGDGRVAHYAGYCRAFRRGPVEVVSLAAFARGAGVAAVVHESVRFSAREIVERALARAGEDCYSLVRNNCEHFCEWCISGEARSRQIEELRQRLRAQPMVALRCLATVLVSRRPVVLA